MIKKLFKSKWMFPAAMSISCICTIILWIYSEKIFYRAVLLCLVSAVLLFLFRKYLKPDYVTKNDTAFHIAASFICFAEINFAYKYWHNCSPVYRLSTVFGMDHNVLAALCAVFLAAFSYLFVVYAAKYTVSELMELNREKLSCIRPYIKPALILFAIYAFAALTIFRANYVYKDDMQRIVNGTTVYTRESRTVAEFALAFLEMDSFFADISPLTQLSELLFMAVSAMIAFAVFTDGKKPSFMDIVAMVPFGLSPYFLECISFKYDPPQHGLAVFCALLPLLFIKLKDSRKYIVITALCIMLSAASHQVPMTVFPAAIIILSVIRLNRDGAEPYELASYIKPSVIGYIAGIVSFKLIIMHSIEYNTGLSSMLSLKELIPGMINNYLVFYGHIFYQYKPVWIVLMLVLCFSFYLEFSLRTKQKRKKAFALNFAACVLLFLLANSLYPLLEAPLHSQRHMYSFGIFTGMVIIAAVSVYENGPVIAKSSAALLASCFFIYAIKYGNLLSYQADYTNYRIEMVVDELSDMDVIKNSDDTVVQIIGSTGYSPTVEALPESDSLMREMITTSFDEYFCTWCASGFYNLYGLKVRYFEGTDPDLRDMELPLVKDNYYYSLYADDEYVLVELKERSRVSWFYYDDGQ